jgi:putative hydrolase of the HAD superfamily
VGAARRIDAVLFDAGGVLVTPDPAQTAIALSPLGGTLDHARHVRAHWAGIAGLEAQLLVDGHDTIDVPDWTLYRRAFAASVGVPDGRLDDAVIALGKIFSSYLWTHPLAEAVAALARLHRAGVPMGVVSNATGQVEHMLRYRGVCQVGVGAGVPVACVVDSQVVGVAKPDPAIFRFALDVLGLLPERVAYVGDSVIHDVGGALAAGMVPLLFDPFDDRAQLEGVERLRSLHELVALFD